MTSITQTIPNYFSGISEQPDELKLPGQLKVAKNVLPDVTQGLIKRPGGKLIGTDLDVYTTVNSKWFHYYRDENEQYIGQVKLSTGEIKMWKCDTGDACTVTYESGKETVLKDYIKQSSSYDDADLQTLTLNDFTYILNRTKIVAMSDTVETVRPPEAFVELKSVAYARQYALNLYGSSETLSTVTTATRVSVEGINLGMDPMLPNVGTKIFNINGIPEVQTIDTSTATADGHYRINDGTTTISVYFELGGNNLERTERLAEGFRNHSDYHKLKFTIGTIAEKDNINDDVTYGTTLRLVFKEGGEQNTLATLKRANTSLGTSLQTLTATRTVTGTNSSDNSKENLYFRITTTGQAVPHPRDETPSYYGRYQTTIDLLHGGEGWTQGQVIEVGFMGCSMEVTIDEISTSKVRANLGLIRPTPTSFDTKTTVTAESILGALRSEIVATGNFTDDNVQQIGNGLYIKRAGTNSINVTTPVNELLNVIGGEVDNIGDLPSQCKHGYVVKVANSAADEDNYYVKFLGNNGRDGEGVWEECPEPGVKIAFDPATMPVQLVRQADGTFKVSQITWENRLVGDTTTVPEPSFVGKTINKMLFFRNRLVILSDENVIMSRPGDFFNFWPKSAITFTATDNIDLSCSSEYPAIVYDGLQVNSGLVLFTKNQQFMLTTDSDILSPLTAKINSLSSYNFNFHTNPLSLGTTIAFLDNAGQYTRFWEMTAVLREGEPNVLEQSKAISKSFPSNLDMIANSRENQVIFFGIKGTKKLYGFRYHTSSEQRIQQAWFEWELIGDIQHIAMLDDALFAIVKKDNVFTMQRFSIRGLSNSLVVTDNQNTTDTTDDITYNVHLDNSFAISSTSINYNSETNKSSFTKPSGFGTSDTDLVVISTGSGSSGRYSTATINGSNIELDDDWSSESVVLGYNYDMQVEFPTIYVQENSKEKFRSKIHDSLVIHRVKFSLGPSGMYETTIKRIGKVDYTQIHETPLSDSYEAGSVAVDNVVKKTVPIYEKNTNLTLTLKSTHPTPATLYSMTWQGDYTNKFYQSV